VENEIEWHMISVTAEYGLRAAVYLARHHGVLASTARISEATHVPQNYLSKVLQAMTRNGLVESQRGPHGGFRLSASPDRVTVYDVIVAADAGLQRIESCPVGLADHTDLCPVHKVVDQAIASAEAALRSVTLGGLLATAHESTPACDLGRVASGDTGSDTRSDRPNAPRTRPPSKTKSPSPEVAP